MSGVIASGVPCAVMAWMGTPLPSSKSIDLNIQTYLCLFCVDVKLGL